MDRRTLLRVVGAGAAGLAGCTSVGGPGNGGTETATETATASESGEGETTANGTGADSVQVKSVVTGLEVPWGAAWREGDLYLTERPGRVVRVPGGKGKASVVTDEFPDLRVSGEGGLLGLAFHPDDPVAYTYGTYRTGGDLENRVVRHAVDDDWRAETLLDGIPAANIHDGGRLLVDDDALYVTTGDSGDSKKAQQRDSLAGKVLRLTLDGDAHPDNPFDSEVFTWGHRNPQGLAVRGEELFSTEHGPSTDDEINLLEAGNNYGWPEARGTGEDRSRNEAFTYALASYTPTIAPGSATFYDGPIERWRGDFFFGTLAGRHLHRVRFDGREVVEQERLYEGEYGRLRTVFTGPDGHLYCTTSNRDGRGRANDGDDRVLRFTPG
jgi:glucose/arabinose dehydrogenase